MCVYNFCFNYYIEAVGVPGGNPPALVRGNHSSNTTPGNIIFLGILYSWGYYIPGEIMISYYVVL